MIFEDRIKDWLSKIYNVSIVASISFSLGLLGYLLIGYFLIVLGIFVPEYGFISLNDPVLSFFGVFFGFSICLGMITLDIMVLIDPPRKSDILPILLVSSLAIGFGISAIYYTLPTFIQYMA